MFNALKEKGHIDFTKLNPDFNISSKAIVNASRSENFIQENTKVVFSAHAIHQMRVRQIDVIEVIAALEGGVRVENISTLQNISEKLIYKVRSHDGIVVIFEDKENTVWVVSAYWE